jgi:hypothetical protein
MTDETVDEEAIVSDPRISAPVPSPKRFTMIRHADASGVSGVGRVLDGVVFADGQTVVRWRVEGKPLSTEIYAAFADFALIHVDSHPANATEIIWFDGVPATASPASTDSTSLA